MEQHSYRGYIISPVLLNGRWRFSTPVSSKLFDSLKDAKKCIDAYLKGR